MTTNVVFAARWKSQQPGTRSLERHRLALLVDAENQARPTGIPEVIRRLEAQYFDVAIRRSFADWSEASTSRWRQHWQTLGFWCIECPRSADGKNGTDARLIETALDLGDYRAVDAVCIVSADSDFTPVIRYLRRLGVVTMAASIGGPPIGDPLKNSADHVFETDPDGQVEMQSNPPRPGESATGELVWEQLIDAAIDLGLKGNRRNDGWVDLAFLGLKARKLYSEFDQRSYGYRKLVDLVQSRPDLFEIDVSHGPDGASHYLIRRNEGTAATLDRAFVDSRFEPASNG